MTHRENLVVTRTGYSTLVEDVEGRLLALVRYQYGWRVRCYGVDEEVVSYSEWATREAAENVALRYAELVA